LLYLHFKGLVVFDYAYFSCGSGSLTDLSVGFVGIELSVGDVGEEFGRFGRSVITFVHL
jgi:hypothetical protein